MPRINVQSETTAVAYGAADEVAEFLDRNQGLNRPFINFTDWFRLGTTGAAAFAFTSNMQPNLAEPVLYAGSTLSVKSISRLIREGFASPAARRRFAGAGSEAASFRSNGHAGALREATVGAPRVDQQRAIKFTSI